MEILLTSRFDSQVTLPFQATQFHFQNSLQPVLMTVSNFYELNFLLLAGPSVNKLRISDINFRAKRQKGLINLNVYIVKF